MNTGNAGPAGACVAALDFGGTKLVFSVVDERGAIFCRSETPRAGRLPRDVAAWAGTAWQAARSQLGPALSRVGAVGATVPGLVDGSKQVLVRAPAYDWPSVPLGALLSEAMGLPATIENDVNACALAEQRFAAAADAAHFLWLTVSTGIGGALVLNSEIFEGRGSAGEIGHIIVEEDGPLCGCGHRGCLEAIASGPALARKAGEQGLAVTDARALFDLAATDPIAAEIIRHATVAVARALAYAVNLLDPERIIVGGGVGLRLDLKLVRNEMCARTVLSRDLAPEVVRTGLAADAGLLGAAAIAFRRLMDPAR